jgi:hypothetical protein
MIRLASREPQDCPTITDSLWNSRHLGRTSVPTLRLPWDWRAALFVGATRRDTFLPP